MLPDLLVSDGIDLRRSGHGRWIACCPFHEERTPSFTVWEDHAHCYGCGWHGGAMKYVMESRHCDSSQAREILRGRGAITVSPPKIINPWQNARDAFKKKEKPKLPPLSPLNQDGIIALAKLRCLSPAGIRMACEAGRLFGGRWLGHQCWILTDATRNVAQFRRFDGKLIPHFDHEIKALTKGSPTWPIGAAELATARTPKVMMVEGGPDMLTAYHFLASWWKISGRYASPEFTPVAMLGSSNRICEEALPYFETKRVRILRHNDEAGLRAAAQWTEQLTLAGAAVETCSLNALSTLSDVRSALFNFDF